MARRSESIPPNCLNCGAPLSGPWCHVCGQPVKGMVRHFSSIMGDVLDTLFEYDNRIWRTLVPLYFRPGRITVDFLAGRRMRYVLPFRLFFVLSVLAFLTLQFVAVPEFGAGARDGWIRTASQFDRLQTVEEVVEARDRALAEMEAGAREMEQAGVPGMAAGAAGMRTGMAAIRRDAERRIAELEGTTTEDPGTATSPPPPGQTLDVHALFAAVESARTVEETIAARDEAVARLEEAWGQMPDPEPHPLGPAVSESLARILGDSRRELDLIAERRIAELGSAIGGDTEDADPGDTAGPEPARQPRVTFGGDGPWDPETNPLVIDWLPEFMNQRLNLWIGRAVENAERVGKDPGRLVEGMFGMLPAVLFVLMPIFALMLKVFYIFKRRLYMEHLVVALHSHSFLFMAILVGAGLSALSGLTAEVPALGFAVSSLATLALIWVPLYLLLMQRRVYAQNWVLTLFKFGIIGIVYTIMISLAVAAAAIISLVNL